MEANKNGMPKNKSNSPDEARILAYLNGELSEGDRREVEEWIATDSPESDMLMGLKELGAAQTRKSNKRLKKSLTRMIGSGRRRSKTVGVDHVTIYIIVILLALIAVAYFVILKYMPGR